MSSCNKFTKNFQAFKVPGILTILAQMIYAVSGSYPYRVKGLSGAVMGLLKVKRLKSLPAGKGRLISLQGGFLRRQPC